MKHIWLIFTAFTALAVQGQEKQATDSIPGKNPEQLEEVIISTKIIGSKQESWYRTGSAYFISPGDLKKFDHTDINRVLRPVPGVNVYEEDGFGLRPNISLRGTAPNRSSKITVMEDGVLAAPAPYSAPAAYYFPTVGRMYAVEVLKGSSQIQYGPFTTGGAINLVSTPIPEGFSGKVEARYGSYNSKRAYTTVGDSYKHFGYMVEYLRYDSDGFKELDKGGPTGFDRNDFLAKFRVNAAREDKTNHILDLKFQYSDEHSDETYVGLSKEDFERTPFRRYAGSREDEMNTIHKQFMGTYTLKFSDYFKVITTGYINSFSRNWYKLNNVVFDGESVSLGNLLASPAVYPDHFDIITGSADNLDAPLYVKANNRKYSVRGVQTRLDYHWDGEETLHDLEVGLRYHYDDEDRFQWVNPYNIVGGYMSLADPGAVILDANRISDARAFAGFITYKLKYRNWTFNPGIRYENITLGRADYGSDDPQRTGSDLSERENKVDVVIPGLGVNYRVDERFSFLAGVHKGFAPPGNSPDEKPEESINVELGGRFNVNGFSGELIGFHNDYSNLLGSDLAATGGTGTLEQFNAGAVRVSGIELLLNYDALRTSEAWTLPLTLAYTFTDTEFKTDFDSAVGIWGEVYSGDELPYIAKHQFNLSAGLEHEKFDVYLNSRYSGAFRTVAGTGSIPEDAEVPAHFIIDMAARYHLNEHLSLTGNIVNLLDETYLVSRVPSGLRPGHPFGAYAGIAARF